MKNILEGAKWGDHFKYRNGTEVILVKIEEHTYGKSYYLYREDGIGPVVYSESGKWANDECQFDIVEKL